MTQSTLLGSVGLFLIPQKMDEDSCSQQDANSFLVLDQQSSQPTISNSANQGSNQQPQLVDHDTVCHKSTFNPGGSVSSFLVLDQQLIQVSDQKQPQLVDHQR